MTALKLLAELEISNKRIDEIINAVVAERDTLKQQNAEMLLEIESLKSSLKRSYAANDHLNDQYKDLAVMKHTRFNDDECWIFDEDDLEENHLESLVCPVVIRARKLREILTKNAELAAQVEAIKIAIDNIRNNGKSSGFGTQSPDSVRKERLAWLQLNEVMVLLTRFAVIAHHGFRLS